MISKWEPKRQNPLVLLVLSKSLKLDSNYTLWIIFRIGEEFVGLKLLEQVAPCLVNGSSSDLVELYTVDPRMGLSRQDLGFWITSSHVFILSILQ